MKKNGIINSHISSVLSYMGHTDSICIADCGLPVPDNIERIDLALKLGTPSFIDVLKEVINDMVVEQIILAKEIKDYNNNILDEIKKILPDVDIEFVTHNEFKKQTNSCRAVIRSGENTPYANIILKSACIF